MIRLNCPYCIHNRAGKCTVFNAPVKRMDDTQCESFEMTWRKAAKRRVHFIIATIIIILISILLIWKQFNSQSAFMKNATSAEAYTTAGVASQL